MAINKLMLFSMMLTISLATGALADSGKILLPLSVHFEATKDAPADPAETNIFTINVQDGSKAANPQSRYNVLLYINSRFEVEFKNETLPFSFKRNLRGLGQGPHELKIDLESASEAVVGRASMIVEVE